MRKIIFLLSVIFFSTVGYAQDIYLKGNLQDTLKMKGVPWASVSLIKSSDSGLIQFTRSAVNGDFEFNHVPQDTYILLVAQSHYVDFLQILDLNAVSGEKDLGEIQMTDRGKLLSEVLIKAQYNVRVKGDTLEYLADSFKVKRGAVVEDLLKVLPGIQVDKDGQITAMGEKVQKVLVNGEEFFGDDPTVATQNMQANIVEKVQVFDAKSEQAQFTGFDDGEDKKTINLKLKKDMDKGYFGKLEAGGGWADRWANQAMINWFEGKRQISAYGIMNSNGKTGLGFEDRVQYAGGGGGRRMFGETEGQEVISSFFTDDDEDDNNFNFGRNRNSKPGINKAWTGGIRYANKMNEDQHHVTANYSFGRVNTELNTRQNTENLLPTGNILRNDTANSFDGKNVHRLSGRYEWNVDSSLNIVYNVNSRLQFKDFTSQESTLNRTSDEVPLSTNQRNNTGENQLTRVSNDLTFNKKLGKMGRTVSLGVNYTYNKKNGNSLLSARNGLALNNGAFYQSFEQKKIDNSSANSVLATLYFTEALSKKLLMKIGYGISNDRADLSTQVFDSIGNGTGNYLHRIDSLSSLFDMNILRNAGNLEFQYNKDKLNLALGSGLSYSVFDQIDNIRFRNYNYNRWNVFPSMRLKYNFNQFRRLTLNYFGSTTNPSPTQIQPVVNNNNPLEIYVGNADLRIGYSQNLNLNFFTFQAISGRGMWIGGNLNHSVNSVGINRTFEAGGRTVNQYVNLPNAYNVVAWLGGMTKIGNKGWDARLNLSGSYGSNPSIVNNIQNRTSTYGINISPNFSYANDSIMYLSFEPAFGYSINQNALNKNKISYFSFNPNLEAAFYLPENFEIGTDIDYQYQPAVNPYPDAFSRFIWGAYVGKYFLEKRNLQLRFSMNDILNQNKGYNRFTNNNYNTESYYNMLGRYWMISAVWNFYSGPLAVSRESGGRMIRHGNRKRR